ncbi:LANO_0H04544g1_1 [Lachancea nothofagi CBS 11611]|uniref:LANO_0H04544g1_1 n=1 Tax=Lachancea nothofagi CBS 11611 TaxID=1266666 RepID=A0A1G4KL73_9SACH|nr:LANO_0H04544g1_1 [Lachancea nothofagi CBS 11611]
MRGSPRSVQELLYQKLMESPGFHRFVRRIYYRINGLQEPMGNDSLPHAGQNFRPTALQKFKAFRVLFWDEMRSVVGLERRFNKRF